MVRAWTKEREREVRGLDCQGKRRAVLEKAASQPTGRSHRPRGEGSHRHVQGLAGEQRGCHPAGVLDRLDCCHFSLCGAVLIAKYWKGATFSSLESTTNQILSHLFQASFK